MLEKIKGSIKNGQFRDIVKIGFSKKTEHRKLKRWAIKTWISNLVCMNNTDPNKKTGVNPSAHEV
jgi:hypothetical protein